MNESIFTHYGNEWIPEESDPGNYPFTVTQSIDGCESDGETVMLSIKETPSPPSGTDISLCEGEPVPDLEAAGEDIKWYTEASCEEIAHTGDRFPTGKTGPGIYTYYATRSLSGCESAPLAINLTIKETPEKPEVISSVVCEGDPVPGLVANGDDILWYNDEKLSDLIFTGSTLQTGKTSPGLYIYYTARAMDDCYSSPSAASLEILEKPTAPLSQDEMVCEGLPIPGLSASGSSVRWYDDEELSNLVHNGEQFIPRDSLPGSYSYFATQTVSGCESEGRMTFLNIKATPEPPAANDISICQDGAVPQLMAEGENVKWYSDPELNSVIHTGNSFTPYENQPDIYRYYLTQSVEECVSQPTAVSYTVKAVPGPPVATDMSGCTGKIIPELVAFGENVSWYSDPELKNKVYEGLYYTPDITGQGSYTFYATQTLDDCEGPEKIIKLDIYETPAVSLGSDTSITREQYLLFGPFSSEYSYQWSDGSALPYLLFNGSNYKPGEHVVFVLAENNACSNVSSVKVRIENPTGIAENTLSNLVVFPNPTPGNVKVLFPGDLPDQLIIEVYDSRGSMIQKYTESDIISVGLHSMEIPLVRPGIYFIRFISERGYFEEKIVRF
ncbi:MAG: T9SS type A sorting domain-containing protein [Bacteroidales bacterium]|nr:T9SS type A sorting domain-containing protein [Bacteroidales bacterium]